MGKLGTLVTVLVASCALGVPAASAAPCEDCPQDGPEGPGGGPAAPLAPTTVTGTFRYAHAGDGNRIRPVRGAEVEVIADSGTTATTTSEQGRFQVTVPFEPGTPYRVEVLAVNRAARVYDGPSVFRAAALDGSGAVLSRTAGSPGSTLDFSTDFTDAEPARHLNVAEVLLRGRAWADAHRDPRETDQIGVVSAVFGTWPSPVSWYDPTVGGGTIRLRPALGLEDLAILHEYAHHLQNRVGTFIPLPSTHGGCLATLGPVDVTSPGLAWLEGFADWFAQVVDQEPVGTPGVSTPSRVALETPVNCGPLGTGHTTDSFEPHVAGLLWDLSDRPGAVLPGTPDDESFSAVEGLVFGIFDHELDVAFPQQRAPMVSTFRTAWYSRGLGWFDPILGLNHIHTYEGSAPAPEPVPLPTPDPKVCAHNPDLPGC